MSFKISPGVEIREVDLSNVVPAVSTSIAAYGGRFRWGPSGEYRTITDGKALESVYGAPNKQDEYSRSFLTAESFLKYGNDLKVSRAVPSDAVNASASGIDGTAATIPTPIGNQAYYDTLSIDGIMAKYPGTMGNSVSVLVITNSNFSDFSAEAGFDNISYIPDTTQWAEELTGSTTVGDEVHFVVVDTNGEFTGTPNTVLEVFEGLSFAENAKKDTGASNYYRTVLGRSSRFINAFGLEKELFDGVTSTVTITAESADLVPTTAQWDDDGDGGTTPEVDIATSAYMVTLADGADGTATGATFTDALDLFIDPEFIDINFLFSEAIDAAGTYAASTQQTIDNKIIEIVKARRDCVGTLSAPIEMTELTTNDLKTDSVKERADAIESCSYIICASSAVQVYNKYTDRFEWIGEGGHIAGLMAYTDQVTDAWYSPAGLNRGQLRGVSQLSLNPNQTQRDTLFKAGVNPIVSFPGQGVLLYGDKTKLARPSSFDRINVRRLFITIEKAIAALSKYSLFEFNDEFTRSAFKGAVEPFLRDVKGRRGITDFRVVCDTTNNTGEVIDSNGFVGDIYVKPAKSIGFIRLNFISTRTGVEFKEIVGE